MTEKNLQLISTVAHGFIIGHLRLNCNVAGLKHTTGHYLARRFKLSRAELEECFGILGKKKVTGLSTICLEGVTDPLIDLDKKYARVLADRFY